MINKRFFLCTLSNTNWTIEEINNSSQNNNCNKNINLNRSNYIVSVSKYTPNFFVPLILRYKTFCHNPTLYSLINYRCTFKFLENKKDNYEPPFFS